jgi:WD40-like Beta Propeller Repeat
MSIRFEQQSTLLTLSLALLCAASMANAAPNTTAAPRLVTNTTSGQNQNPTIDSGGRTVVFTSAVDHSSLAVLGGQPGSFDFDNTGNAFTPAGAIHPNPVCENCDAQNGLVGNLFVWYRKKKTPHAENSFQQITFSTAGGFTANQLPDINQRGTHVGWDSDQDHASASCKKLDGSPCSNGDNNREAFLIELKTGLITQLTDTTGGLDASNRYVNLNDDGKVVVFESTRDFAGVFGCTLTDGTTACDNSDNNTEVMLLDRKAGKFVQVTNTTGGTTTANSRPRVSPDGRYVAFASTRDFSALTNCKKLDGTTACANDNNSEIMLFDRKKNVLTQITDTSNSGACLGSSPNERVEISARARSLSFQSKCEAQLNPAGCGTCSGNDEVFFAEPKSKKITQLTISQGGFNRVPRVSGSGNYVVFQTDREYLGQGQDLRKTLFVLKRNGGKTPAGESSPMQLLNDANLVGVVQNPKTYAVHIDILGGFNTTVEQFGISNSGKFVVFDNQSGVRNQEIWWIDRTKP